MGTLSGGPNIVIDGLIFYLDASNQKSYLTPSTTWDDLSKTKLTSSLINGPSFSDSNKGVITFDGIDDYVICANPIFAFGTSPFSLSYWFYVDDFRPAKVPTLTDCRKTNDEFGLATYIASQDSTFRMFWDNTVKYISKTKIIKNKWYNILIVKDQTDRINVYINGIFDGYIFDRTNFTAGELKLGRNVNIKSPSYLYGKIANLLVYDRALSDSEGSQNFNSLKNRFI